MVSLATPLLLLLLPLPLILTRLLPPRRGEDPALEPMPLASGVPFMIKAITNSTYNHHGEMAFPEVTLAPWKNTSAFAPRQ